MSNENKRKKLTFDVDLSGKLDDFWESFDPEALRKASKGISSEKTVFINPADRGTLRKSIGVDFAYPDSDHTIYGLPIIESSFVETGTAYIVPEFPNTFKPMNMPDNFDFEVFQGRLLSEINRSFGLPSHYFNAQTQPSWQRLHAETFIEWGKRLDREGYLDNPDIRWEYQKATWALIYKTLINAAMPLYFFVLDMKGNILEHYRINQKD